jgi:hypothetical protein
MSSIIVMYSILTIVILLTGLVPFVFIRMTLKRITLTQLARNWMCNSSLLSGALQNVILTNVVVPQVLDRLEMINLMGGKTFVTNLTSTCQQAYVYQAT